MLEKLIYKDFFFLLMECVKCGKKAVSGYLRLCRACFLEVIEKRVRKEFRMKELVKKNDSVLILDDGTYDSKNMLYLTKKIIGKMPVFIKIKKGNYVPGKKINFKGKIMVPWNLDDEAAFFLRCFFEKKKIENIGNYGNIIKPLAVITDDESRQFSRIMKFDFKDKKKGKVNDFLDSMEKRYPGTKFGIARSIPQIVD
jgi:hypothetical protein